MGVYGRITGLPSSPMNFVTIHEVTGRPNSVVLGGRANRNMEVLWLIGSDSMSVKEMNLVGSSAGVFSVEEEDDDASDWIGVKGWVVVAVV